MSGTAVLELDLDKVAEHPDNPRTELRNIDQLATSLQARGLIQPIVVCPVDEFISNRPDGDPAVDQLRAAGVTHVTTAGHRRRAAAIKAGWSTIRAIEDAVVGDSAGAAAATFIVENLHRDDLTPLEEAAGYALMRDMGKSQRVIAAECGVSQSHVSKRLALLKMPQEAQDALAAGKITLDDAAALTALSVDDQVKAWKRAAQHSYISVRSAAAEIARDNAAQKAVEKARRQAKSEGVELAVRDDFGRDWWAHRVVDEEEIEAAREAGTLRGVATPQGLEYFSTEIPEEDAAVERRQQERDRDQRERKRAIKARQEALQRLVAKPPPAKLLLAELAAAVINQRGADNADALRQAYAWLQDCIPAPQSTDADKAGKDNEAEDSTGYRRPAFYDWRDALPEKHRPWLAWAMAVAADESSARTTWSTWGPRQAAHVRRLVDRAGYTPTEWESEQLTRIDAKHAEPAASDSDGIAQAGDGYSEQVNQSEQVDQVDDVDPDDPEQNWIDADRIEQTTAADPSESAERVVRWQIQDTKYGHYVGQMYATEQECRKARRGPLYGNGNTRRYKVVQVTVDAAAEGDAS